MLSEVQRNQLRAIPSVHDILHHSTIISLALEEIYGRDLLTQSIQDSIEELRKGILANKLNLDDSEMITFIVQQVTEKINQIHDSPLKPLINGTGVVLHTNLGRAKLSKKALEELVKVSGSYSNLEFQLEEGIRGSRHSIVEKLICHLTGAEAALVCNNNAAAVFLTLRELARDKEVIVSRGELVEIGGSFRVSEIMRESGAKLVEVGTTNKTHMYDYEKAITSETGLIMKVHTSNFVIKGFTAAVEGSKLTEMAHSHGIPVFEDLGSGVLFDLKPFGIGSEPTVQEVIKEGVDIVSFSGDKLLGGPQAGIIAGKKVYIDRLKKNQLMRSLRVDKFTLAALHATLSSYLNPKKAKEEIPTLHMILMDPDHIKDKAERFIAEMDQNLYHISLVPLESEIGGGTMPEVKLQSWGVEITSTVDKNVATLSRRLRLSKIPIIGRVHQDRFILDFRTIAEDEIPYVVNAFSTTSL